MFLSAVLMFQISKGDSTAFKLIGLAGYLLLSVNMNYECILPVPKNRERAIMNKLRRSFQILLLASADRYGARVQL